MGNSIIRRRILNYVLKTILIFLGSCFSLCLAIALWTGMAFVFDNYAPTYSQPVFNILSGIILLGSLIFFHFKMYKKVYKSHIKFIVYLISSAMPFIILIGIIIYWIKTFPFL